MVTGMFLELCIPNLLVIVGMLWSFAKYVYVINFFIIIMEKLQGGWTRYESGWDVPFIVLDWQ